MNIQTPINGDALRAMCDSHFWHNASPVENRAFRHGDAVFCKIDEVWRLFRALRRTRKRIVLVTGEGDKPVDGELWVQKPRHVAAWFGTNMFVDDPTSVPVPLGLGNATAKVTLSWAEIQQATCAAPARDRLLYANFGTRSNPAVREPLLAWLQAPARSWVTREPHTAQGGRAAYLQQLLAHHFVLCPPGNGEDTHRMWEAIACGAIPVVRHSPAMRNFLDLPILFVGDFLEVNETLLRQVRETGLGRAVSRDKLFAAVWAAEIAKARDQARMQGPVTLRELWISWLREGLRLARQPRMRD